MKNFTRKNAQQKINRTLSNLEKQGYNINDVLKGKSIEKHAWSSKSLNEFNKSVKRVKEKPKILNEVKQYDIIRENKKDERIKSNTEKREKQKAKRLKQKQKYNYANTLTDKTKSIVKFNLNMQKVTKKAVKLQVKKELFYLVDTYFKELKGTKHEGRINALINRFGTRLDLAHKFIDFIAQKEFAYPFEKDIYKESMPDDYFAHMVERLDEFESYAKNTLNL